MPRTTRSRAQALEEIISTAPSPERVKATRANAKSKRSKATVEAASASELELILVAEPKRTTRKTTRAKSPIEIEATTTVEPPVAVKNKRSTRTTRRAAGSPDISRAASVSRSQSRSPHRRTKTFVEIDDLKDATMEEVAVELAEVRLKKRAGPGSRQKGVVEDVQQEPTQPRATRGRRAVVEKEVEVGKADEEPARGRSKRPRRVVITTELKPGEVVALNTASKPAPKNRTRATARVAELENEPDEAEEEGKVQSEEEKYEEEELPIMQPPSPRKRAISSPPPLAPTPKSSPRKKIVIQFEVEVTDDEAEAETETQTRTEVCTPIAGSETTAEDDAPGTPTPHTTTPASRQTTSKQVRKAVEQELCAPLNVLSLTPRQKRILERNAAENETEKEEPLASMASRSSAGRAARGVRPSPQPAKGLVGQRVSLFNKDKDEIIFAPRFIPTKTASTPIKSNETIARTSRATPMKPLTPLRSIRKAVETPAKSIRTSAMKPLAPIVSTPVKATPTKQPIFTRPTTRTPAKEVSIRNKTEVKPVPASPATTKSTRESPRKASITVPARQPIIKPVDKIVPKTNPAPAAAPSKPIPLPAVLRKAAPVVALSKAAQLRQRQSVVLRKTSNPTQSTGLAKEVKPTLLPAVLRKAAPVVALTKAAQMRLDQAAAIKASEVGVVDRERIVKPIVPTSTATKLNAVVAPIERKVAPSKVVVAQAVSGVGVAKPIVARNTATTRVVSSTTDKTTEIAKQTTRPAALVVRTTAKSGSRPNVISNVVAKTSNIPARDIPVVSKFASRVDGTAKEEVSTTANQTPKPTRPFNASPYKSARAVSTPIKLTSTPSFLISPSKPPTQPIPFSLAGDEHAKKAALIREERAKKREEEDRKPIRKSVSSINLRQTALAPGPVARPRPMMQRSLSTSARGPLAVASASVTNSNKESQIKPILKRPSTLVTDGAPSSRRTLSQIRRPGASGMHPKIAHVKAMATPTEDRDASATHPAVLNAYGHAMELLEVQAFKEVQRMSMSTPSTPVAQKTKNVAEFDDELMNSIQKEKFRLEASVRGHQALLQWAAQQSTKK